MESNKTIENQEQIKGRRKHKMERKEMVKM